MLRPKLRIPLAISFEPDMQGRALNLLLLTFSVSYYTELWVLTKYLGRGMKKIMLRDNATHEEKR